MADPFLSEIRMYGFKWAPKGWAVCDGQLMQISQNAALFSLLGIAYGGDGHTVFGLPDMRSRTPIHVNWTIGMPVGYRGGQENVTLTSSTMAAHRHVVQGSSAPGTLGMPTNKVMAEGKDYATPTIFPSYAPPNDLVALDESSIDSLGGGGAHPNMQPTIVVNFVIAITGEYPQRN